MSETRYGTETIRRVYDNQIGGWVEVGPDSDGIGGLVEIRTDEKNAENFGSTRLCLNPGMARELAKAILAAADEIAKETP